MSDDGPMGAIPSLDDDLSLPKATVQKLISGISLLAWLMLRSYS